MQLSDRDPFNIYRDEDSRLTIGTKVTAYWHSQGYHFRARAKVVKLERRCVTIALLETAGQGGEYSLAKRIQLPRFFDNSEWTTERCVRLGKPARFSRI